MKNKFIERIEEIRQNNGLSKKKMAEYCGIDEKYFRKMINNDTMPQLETLERICVGMDITLQQFFTSDKVFGTATEAQEALIKCYMGLDPDNKQLLLKIATELKGTQDKKIGDTGR